MKIPCTHGAPFSSLLSRNGSCLPRQDILGLEVDGMDQAAAYRQIYTIVHPRDGVRASTQYVAQTIVPSRSHRYNVPEVEIKKNSILVTLGDFCLFGLRRVFAGFCKFQVVLDASPTVSLCFINRDLQPSIPAVNGVTLQKRRPKASTDDRPSTRKLLFSFSFR